MQNHDVRRKIAATKIGKRRQAFVGLTVVVAQSGYATRRRIATVMPIDVFGLQKLFWKTRVSIQQ
jgi:hypothetical protein